PARVAPMLAVAGLAAHESIKCTTSGAPHRVHIKKHARRLSMDEGALFELAKRAIEQQALTPDADGTLLPEPAVMADIAAGKIEDGEELGPVVRAWLADGPLPEELVV